MLSVFIEPTAPLDVKILMTGEESVTVGWAEPNPPQGNITNYDVVYWMTRNEPSKQITLNVGRTRLSYQIRDLALGVTYSIQVRPGFKFLN